MQRRWDLGVDEVGTVPNKQDTGKGKEKQEANQSAKLDQTLLKEIHDIEIEPPPIKEKQTLVETIIGTVVIAVIGVEEAVGTTHTALLVTNFIARKGRKVAIIEANDHRDFAKIEATYEGMIDPRPMCPSSVSVELITTNPAINTTSPSYWNKTMTILFLIWVIIIRAIISKSFTEPMYSLS